MTNKPETKNFTDIQKLALDIIKHYTALIEENGGPIKGTKMINDDEPYELMLGFRCLMTGKRWTIKIRDLKDYIRDMTGSESKEDNLKGETLQQAIMTQEGKIAMAGTFYSLAEKKYLAECSFNSS